MIDHKDYCTVTLNGVCNCQHRNALNPKAGTSRTVDTEPRVTWLGIHKLPHPPWCGVYKAPEANWAPYCTCRIKDMQNPSVPMTDPADVGDPTDAAPREFQPIWFRSRAPWWVWSLIGFGAGLGLGTSLAGWPW